MGYHNKLIPKGIFSQFSKIKEEILELGDVIEQNNKILVLNELSDIIGAVEYYLINHFQESI